MFLAEIDHDMAQLTSALENHDVETLSNEAHTLKGIARQLCASLMADAAYRVEIVGEKGEMETAGVFMGQLEQEAKKLLAVLKREI